MRSWLAESRLRCCACSTGNPKPKSELCKRRLAYKNGTMALRCRYGIMVFARMGSWGWTLRVNVPGWAHGRNQAKGSLTGLLLAKSTQLICRCCIFSATATSPEARQLLSTSQYLLCLKSIQGQRWSLAKVIMSATLRLCDFTENLQLAPEPALTASLVEGW